MMWMIVVVRWFGGKGYPAHSCWGGEKRTSKERRWVAAGSGAVAQVGDRYVRILGCSSAKEASVECRSDLVGTFLRRYGGKHKYNESGLLQESLAGCG